MDLSQRNDLVQQQTLHLTTELRQGLAVLQLNAVDLAEYVNSCIEANPVFALDSYARDDADPTRVRPDEAISNTPHGKAASTTADANRTVYSGIDRYTSRLSTDALLEGRGHGSPATFDSERHDMSQRRFSLDRFLEVPETLAEHLMSQLRMVTNDERMRAIGGFLAGSLDSSGYLTISIDEAAEALGVDSFEVEQTLALIQHLNPVGIAARSLAECLRLQIESEGRMTAVIDVLLADHLADLERKSVASVASDMGVSQNEIEEALSEIRACNPRPGLQFNVAATAVWPEVVVERVGDGVYQVKLQDLFLPELRVDEQYRTLAETTRDKNASHYLKERIREAEGLIDGIAYRNETLYKMACCITELQVEFLDEGINRLRPLTMAQVAEAVGVSQSTISRLANGNYIQTPRGTFELRFFFHGSTQAKGAVEVSSLSVKRRIKELIEAEDPAKPLSDKAIADELMSEGVSISRRTVAKYRDQLGIPVRAARKRT